MVSEQRSSSTISRRRSARVLQRPRASVRSVNALRAVQQLAWRGCYEMMAGRLPRPEWAFMNYGFIADPAERDALRLEPSDEPDRLCIKLYDHVVGASELTGRDVLEVGSGRGGGASYLGRYRAPRSVTGVELAHRAVELSRRHRQGPGLRFVQGDAQALPYPDDAFDLVVNVESSHCYPSMTTFVAEVGPRAQASQLLPVRRLSSGR